MSTLWYGGPIYTMKEEGDGIEAVLTEGERIVATGSIEEIERNYYIHEYKNLEGRTMFPGFVDSHLHLIGHGEKLFRLDLSSFRSKAEVLAAVAHYVKDLKKGEWVIGEGWNENLWSESSPILRNDLDEITTEHPVMLKRICRHTLVANSLALQVATIDEYEPYDGSGVVEREDSGRLNGIFREEAQDLILKAIPHPSDEYLKKALQISIKAAHAHGLTGGHTEDLSYYNGYGSTTDIFKNVIEREGVRFRAHLLVHHKVMAEFAMDGGYFLKGNKWIEYGAIKIFADGSLGGRTALLSHPYADDPSTNGVAIFSQEELNQLVKRARDLDMPIAVHAIGDLAFEMTLQAIESHPLNSRGKDRLIHAQILRKDLLERAKQLPIILDIQPSFVASDFPWVIERIGEEHLDYCYAWKTLINEGFLCAGGSDAPIEEIDPLIGIHTAVTRTNHKDYKKTPYRPEEAISVFEAVCLYTKGSAAAASHEEERGMIQPGFYADFTILDQDILHCPKDEIIMAKVAMTVVGGEVVYVKSNG